MGETIDRLESGAFSMRRHAVKREGAGGGGGRAGDDREPVGGTEGEDGERNGLFEQSEMRAIGRCDKD